MDISVQLPIILRIISGSVTWPSPKESHRDILLKMRANQYSVCGWPITWWHEVLTWTSTDQDIWHHHPTSYYLGQCHQDIYHHFLSIWHAGLNGRFFIENPGSIKVNFEADDFVEISSTIVLSILSKQYLQFQVPVSYHFFLNDILLFSSIFILCKNNSLFKG